MRGAKAKGEDSDVSVSGTGCHMVENGICYKKMDRGIYLCDRNTMHKYARVVNMCRVCGDKLCAARTKKAVRAKIKKG